MVIYPRQVQVIERYATADLDKLKQGCGVDFESLEHLVRAEAGDEILQHSRRSIDYALELYCNELNKLKLDGDILELYKELGDGVLVVTLGDLLHDIKWPRTPEENMLIKHAEDGANFLESTSRREIMEIKKDILSQVIFYVRYHTPWETACANKLTWEFMAAYDGEKIDFILNHQESGLCVPAYESLYLAFSKEIVKTNNINKIQFA